MQRNRVTASTPLPDLPEFLTVEELQEYLCMGRSAAYDFARCHGVKFGRLVRVPKSALVAATFIRKAA